MTSKEAKELRDEIGEFGLHCVIPRGQKYPTIYTTFGVLQFESRYQWHEYKKLRAKIAELNRRAIARPKSTIDAMIDKACGVTEGDYQ